MNGSMNQKLNQQISNNPQEDFPRSKILQEDFPRSKASEEDFPRSKASEEDFPRSRASREDFPRSKPRSLMEMPFTMSPIPLSEASLRGQWSHSSPYQQSPPNNRKHEPNRRYQDRFQSSYYDRKRDDRNRKRRK